ncbi:MAG TPA: hypothetical protein VMY69_00345 [Phycisphaerae bacterium]|nr:hypothetical protein [Phycisphaerae bacterium]
MTERQETTRFRGCRAVGATLVAWLAASPRGRWATARGRWCQMGLTLGLLLAALGAWAVALVQPWTVQAGDPGVVTMAAGVDTRRIRSAGDEVDRLFRSPAGAELEPLRRNPFAGPWTEPAADGLAPAPAPVAEPEGPARRGVAVASPASRGPADAAATTPQAILDAVKALKLQVILLAPDQQRWAVINGKNYRRGDAVAGFDIVEIRETTVKLRQAGITCLLRID